MNANRIIATTAALLVAASGGSAFAAAAAPAAAVPVAPTAPQNFAPPPGPPIAGFCAFSYERMVADSSVGKAFAARLQQLGTQVQAELNPERTTLENDARTLQGQRASLPADQFEQRATALNTRIQAYQQKEQLRSAELQQTRDTQLQRIVQTANPLVVSAYTTRRCSVVMDASGLIAVNEAMDITNDVVALLNTRMSTITFDRDRIDPNTGGPAAAGPAAPAR